MTMKSILIVPMTLLAALAAGVLVHDRLGTKSHVDDAVPTQTASIASAEPVALAPVSPPPVSAALPLSQEASLVADGAPTRTASIGAAGPATQTSVSLPPFSAAPPGSPETVPPLRMTASQEASLNAWMIRPISGVGSRRLKLAAPIIMSRGCGSYSNPTDRSRGRRSSSIRRPIPRRSRRQRECCRLSRHATLYRYRLNIAPFMSNGRPRLFSSILRLPRADPVMSREWRAPAALPDAPSGTGLPIPHVRRLIAGLRGA
jgi:hypothetical protein